ncbi:hypothetical protein LIA77_07361 [Sarocladium implicatum]|nr:hypothetical protein LIA77_07361 [Sarocladium implicatum]
MLAIEGVIKSTGSVRVGPRSDSEEATSCPSRSSGASIMDVSTPLALQHRLFASAKLPHSRASRSSQSHTRMTPSARLAARRAASGGQPHAAKSLFIGPHPLPILHPTRHCPTLIRASSRRLSHGLGGEQDEPNTGTWFLVAAGLVDLTLKCRREHHVSDLQGDSGFLGFLAGDLSRPMVIDIGLRIHLTLMEKGCHPSRCSGPVPPIHVASPDAHKGHPDYLGRGGCFSSLTAVLPMSIFPMSRFR